MVLNKVLRRSRRSFFTNYSLAITGLIGVWFLYFIFEVSALVMYISLIPIFLFALEPEYSLLDVKYIVQDENILKIKGIVSKKKEFIPWHLVAHAEMKQGIISRMLNVGDVVVSSATGSKKIILRGLDNPNKILKSIELKTKNKQIA